MTVASKDLCQELYKLAPDWFDTFAKYYLLDGALSLRPSIKIDDDWPGHVLEVVAPAYDLGYLLRKLPDHIGGSLYAYQLQGLENRKGTYTYTYGEGYKATADTPEDAACSLAIALFKQGILKAGGTV